MKTRILIDSAGDLPFTECEKMDIEFLPIPVFIDDEEFQPGINLSTDEFFQKFYQGKKAKTSLVNQFRFEEIFNEVKEKGDELLVFVLSKELSGTYYEAVKAYNAVGYDKIYIVNHQLITVAQAALVLEAVKMRDNGLKGEEIAKKCEELAPKIKLYAYFKTLKYLKEGGRLSGTAAVVGTLLNIKPIIELREGKLFNVHKCMGVKKAAQYLIEKVKDENVDENFPIYFGHVDAAEDLEEFIKDFKVECQEFKNGGSYAIGSTIAAHTGPGCVAVIFFSK